MGFGKGCQHGGVERFSAVAGRKVESSLRSGCRASTPAPKDYGYPRSHRLTRESDLEKVKRAGRRLRTEHLDVRALVSLLSHPRVAVVVGKQGHTIVERNRLRRRLRELTRTMLIPQVSGLDLMVRALPTAYGATFDQLKDEVETLISRLRAAK